MGILLKYKMPGLKFSYIAIFFTITSINIYIYLYIYIYIYIFMYKFYMVFSIWCGYLYINIYL